MAATRHVTRGLLDHLLKTASFTVPTDITVALLDNTGTELTGTNYARVTHNTWNAATDADPAEASNDGIIQFATPGADGWGTAERFALYDDAETPNKLIEAALPEAKTINENDDVSFASGALKVRFGPLASFS